MALINWENGYSVKVGEIDEQHKAWINLINYLHEAMKSGKGKEILGDILDEVINYTVYHFNSEEKFFAKYNYPDTIPHQKLHNDFVLQFRQIKKDYESGSTILSIEVMNRLKDWLTNHILTIDKQYSSFLNSKGVN